MTQNESEIIGMNTFQRSQGISKIQDKIFDLNMEDGKVIKRTTCNRNVQTGLLVGGLSVTIAFILLLIVFLIPGTTNILNPEKPDSSQTVIIYVSVYLPEAQYQDDYSNSSSQQFKQFENTFCGNVSSILEYGTVSGYDGCKVTQLSKGSVLVNSNLTYNGEVDQTSTTLDAIALDLQTNLTYIGEAVVEAVFVPESSTTVVQLPSTQTSPTSSSTTPSSTSTPGTSISTTESTSTTSTSSTTQSSTSTTQSSTSTSTTANPNNTCGGITCQNEGYCILNGVDAHCLCRDGYTGDLCETDIDECASNPCQNNGTCVDKVNGYDCFCAICECADIEAGPNCENDIRDPCSDNGWGFFYHPDSCSDYIHCQNYTLYDKHCCQGLVFYAEVNETSRRCDHPSDSHTCAVDREPPCQQLQCVHGTCSSRNPTQCECMSGYIGKFCDTQRLTCANLACENGGLCDESDSSKHAHCVCPDTYTGDRCQTVKDQCDPNPCKNGGTCIKGDGQEYTCYCGYTCQCANEFDKHCSYNLSTCADVPSGRYPHPTNCSQHIDCTCDNRNDVDCNSENSTTHLVWDSSAATCTFKKDVACAYQRDPPCNDTQCTHGQCSDADPTKCECDAEYIGKLCDQVRLRCSNITCENGGSCDETDIKMHAQCMCPELYDGDRCQRDKNPCDPNPCKHGATCVRGASQLDYSCFCGYECKCANELDAHCSYDLRGCKDTPDGNYPHPDNCTMYITCLDENLLERDCNNRSLDTDLVFDPSLGNCNRRDNVTCSSEKVNPCDAKPCLNDGICTPSEGLEYTCDCTYACSCANSNNYAGDSCEIDLTSCDGKSDGVYPFPHDCSKFVQCVGEVSSVLDCDPGNNFNPDTNYCEVDPLCSLTPGR